MQKIPNYSTSSISQQLVDEICETLKGLDYGSVELYVADGNVTQITKRHIKKTNTFKAYNPAQKR